MKESSSANSSEEATPTKASLCHAKRYLLLLFEGGTLASIQVDLPEQNDNLVTAILWLDDDLLLDLLVPLIFVGGAIVSVCLKRRHSADQLRIQQENMRLHLQNQMHRARLQPFIDRINMQPRARFVQPPPPVQPPAMPDGN